MSQAIQNHWLLTTMPSPALLWVLETAINRHERYSTEIMAVHGGLGYIVADNASAFDYILAPPSRVLVSQHRPSASGLIP
jgi:hypothetical protein